VVLVAAVLQMKEGQGSSGSCDVGVAKHDRLC
jgi:hypothetical protein